MKRLASLVYLVLLPLQAFSAGRESGGGGGNGFAAEFRRLGAQAEQAFFEHQVINLAGKDFDHHPFRAVLEVLVLEPTQEQLTLEGKKVSSINYPASAKVVFNVDDWAKFDHDAKMQLVIHEILGLKYRNQFDDSRYECSRQLLTLTKKFTFEAVALAAARAGNAIDYQMRLIPARTRVISEKPDGDGLGNDRITEVAVQTFENSSTTAVRVYHIYSHDMLGIRKVELVALEGGAGT
jgi:hypothetical protein